MKPIFSAGSVNTKICSNKQDMVDYLKEQFSLKDDFGLSNDNILVQERINGDEYLVNTVS